MILINIWKNESLIDVQISNGSLKTTYHFVFVDPLYKSTDNGTFPLIFCVDEISAIYKKNVNAVNFLFIILHSINILKTYSMMSTHQYKLKV